MNIVEVRIAHIEYRDTTGDCGDGVIREVIKISPPTLQYRDNLSAKWQTIPSVIIKHDDPENPCNETTEPAT